MQAHIFRLLPTILLSLLFAAPLSAQQTWYVRASAPPNGDGLSWGSAFRDLQDALSAATAADEIWVATGLYRPDRGTGNRELSFVMKSGVALYGGFGGTETSKDERDLVLYQTILSGNIGNVGTQSDNSKHVVDARNVNNLSQLDGFIVRDGFADVGPFPGTYGAGMIATGSTVVVANCTFQRNVAEDQGGAVYVENGSVTLINTRFISNESSESVGGAIAGNFGGNFVATECLFRFNKAERGGAFTLGGASSSSFTDCQFMENWCTFDDGGGCGLLFDSPVVFTNCEFTGNFVDDNQGEGGALYLWNDSDAAFIGCTFRGNFADFAGAIQVDDAAPVFTDCTFEENIAEAGGVVGVINNAAPEFVGCHFEANQATDNGGGVLYSNTPSNLKFTSCTLVGNSAHYAGAILLHSTSGTGTIRNCTFIGNTVAEHGGALRGSPKSVINCVFEQNHADGNGGAVWISGTDTLFRDSVIRNNTAGGWGGGLFIRDEITLRDCLVEENQAVRGGGLYADGFNIDPFPLVLRTTFLNNSADFGGAILTRNDSPIQFWNCRFLGNSATNHGGAAYLEDDSIPVFVNSLFSGNSATLHGGAVYVTGADPAFKSCSLTLNVAGGVAGGIVGNSSTFIDNSILWGNTDSGSNTQVAQISGSVMVNYSCIEGLTGTLGGEGNIGEDPRFTDPDGEDDIPGTLDDDMVLKNFSPVINKGDNQRLPADIYDIDMDGNVMEPVPFDANGNARIFDNFVDMGGLESDAMGGGPGVYVGPKGGTWFDPANWQGGELPDESTDVVIPTHVVIDQPGAIAATVTVVDGGTLEIGNGSLTTPLLDLASGGTLRLSHESAVIDVTTLAIAESAIVNWQSGTIRLDGGTLTSAIDIEVASQGAGALVLRNAAQVNAPSLDVATQGSLRGNGTVNAPVTNRGRIAPGESIGALHISDVLVMDNTGTLEFELESYGQDATTDHLTVTNLVSLAGTLETIVLDPSEPEIRSFEMLSAGSIEGTFGSIVQTDPPGSYIAGFTQTMTTLSVGATVPGPRLYIKMFASGDGTGADWANALGEVQVAFNAAAMNPSITEFWVAQGEYFPYGAGNIRESSFVLRNNLALYGGFNGTEQTLDERDVLANPTTLTGDVNSNDGPGFANHDDNVFTVVRAVGIDSSAVLDGFIVRGGYSEDNDDFGGGMQFTDASPTIRHCIILENFNYNGAGAYVLGGSPAFENCRFELNWNSFEGSASGNGGGVFLDQAGDVTFIDCSFIECETSGNGGAIFMRGSSASIADTTFSDNRASDAGGAIFQNASSQLTVTACAFDSNRARGTSTVLGGAITSSQGSSLLIQDSYFSLNEGYEGGALFVAGPSTDTTIENCQFIANTAGRFGGALAMERAAATVTSTIFDLNESDRHGGAIFVESLNDGDVMLELNQCDLLNNSAGIGGTAGRGGAVYFSRGTMADGLLTLAECSFISNTALEHGGHVYLYGRGLLDDTMFVDGASPDGLGMHHLGGGELRGTAAFLGNDDLVNGDDLHVGFEQPGNRIGVIEVQGGLRRLDHGVSSNVYIDIAGLDPGVEFDVIDASQGTVELSGGGLIAGFIDDFEPSIGEQFNVIKAQNVMGRFSVVSVDGLMPSQRAKLLHDANGLTIGVGELLDVIQVDSAIDDAFNGVPVDTMLADVDNDGDHDVLLVVKFSDQADVAHLRVLRNAGVDMNNDWLGLELDEPGVMFTGVPTAFTASDFNDDDFIDIAVSNLGTQVVNVFFNDGAGGFTLNASYPSFGQLTDITSHDVNDDGSPDLVGVNQTTNQIAFFPNDGAGGFLSPLSFNTGAGPQSITLADVDGDGILDALVSCASQVTSPQPPSLRVHRGAIGSFGSGDAYTAQTGAGEIVAADLNRDTYPDAVIVNREAKSMTVFVNRGDGSGDFVSPVHVPTGEVPLSIDALDVEGDGDFDLLVALENAAGLNAVRLFRNDFVGLQPIITSADAFVGGGDARLVRIGDLNSDSALDFVSAGLNAGVGGDPATVSSFLNRSSAHTNLFVSDLNVVFGTLLKGGVPEISHSENDYLRTRSAIGFSALEPNIMVMQLTVESVGDMPNIVDVLIESRINHPNGSATVRVRNFSLNQFQVIGTYPIGMTETTETIAGIDTTNRMNNEGQMLFEIKHVVPAVFSALGFDSSFDLVQIQVP